MSEERYQSPIEVEMRAEYAAYLRERAAKDQARLRRRKTRFFKFLIAGACIGIIAHSLTIFLVGFSALLFAALAGAIGTTLILRLQLGILPSAFIYALPHTIYLFSIYYTYFANVSSIINALGLGIGFMFSLGSFPILGGLFGLWKDLEGE